MAWLELAITKLGFLTNSGNLSYGIWSCLAILLAVVFYEKTKKWRLIDQIPGPKTVPILGNALDLNVSPQELFNLGSGNFCDPRYAMTRVWVGWVACCLIYKAKSVEVILSSHKHIEKSIQYRFMHAWLGTGLLTAPGKKWHGRRKMLTPAFHFKILEDFVGVFNEQSSVLVTKLSANADTGKAFDIFQYITLCTLDVIFETAMGRSINAQKNSDSDYVKAVYKLSEIMQKRQTRPLYYLDFIFNLTNMKKEQDNAINILHTLSNNTIVERRKLLQNSNISKETIEEEEDIYLGRKRKLAFLDLLLDYSNNNRSILSDEDIREEIDTFMFEGHDTTAAAINWSLYLFGLHPEIQEKVYDEIHSILGDSDRTITSADVKQMKYFGCCMKEALRIFPSVPMFARELTEDVMIDGHMVPAGTNVLIITYKLHRDIEVFPDPEVFQPERFLPENCKNRNPYAYIPFSAGPRNCIGQKFAQLEDKIILANLLRNYRFESVVKREDLQCLGELILRPDDGNMVKLFKRK